MALFARNYCYFQNVWNSLYRTPFAVNSILSSEFDIYHNQKRYAKRKGKRIAATREKQRLARERKIEMKNAPPKVWKPKHLLMDKTLKGISKKFSDENRKNLSEIVDNVYVIEHYKERKHSFVDAMAMIREVHQPEIYDEPDALVEAKIELDLRTKKKTKFVERIDGIVSYPNLFNTGAKRKVLAICKTIEDEEKAKNAGAELAGCGDIIRMLKAGDIIMDNFDDLVCHGDMLLELVAIKNVVGSYFPTKQRGNVGFDVERLVKYFTNAIEYKLIKDSIDPDYGYIQVAFGRLTLSDKELEKNFEYLLSNVEKYKGDGAKCEFITRVLLRSDPSPEKHALAFWNHIDGYKDPTIIEEEEAEAENKEKSAGKL